MTHPQYGGGYGQQQQGGYGPLPGYPQPGGYGPQPPKKPNTGLVVGIVAAVVVAALGLVLVLALTGDDDNTAGGGGGTAPGGGGIPDPTLKYTATENAPGGSDSGPAGGDSGPDGGTGSGGAANPGELALTVAQIIEEHDTDAIEEYACNAGEAHSLQQDLAQLDGMDVTARPQAIEETSETMAEVTIKLTFQGQTADYPLRMQLRDDSWCAISAT